MARNHLSNEKGTSPVPQAPSRSESDSRHGLERDVPLLNSSPYRATVLCQQAAVDSLENLHKSYSPMG